MLRAQGYATIIGGSGTVAAFERGSAFKVESDLAEFDTFGCVHCSGIVHVPVRTKDTDYFFCRNCMARICGPCADHPCTPFMKKVEMQEARDRQFRCMGIV